MLKDDSSNRLNLEKTALKISFIPIICSAPLIYAQSQGYFEKNGLSVRMIPAPGWSAIKGLLVYGHVDAVHMLSPMPLSCNLGMDGKKADIRLVVTQNVNGQALTLANKHLGIKDVHDMKGFTFGVPYRFSMHYYLLCHFLAVNGINPLKEVTIKEVAPPQMPFYLKKGWVDGVFAPEPFNQIPVHKNIGFIYILSRDIWQGHPCCSFATSQDFIDRYPNTYQAMLKSLLEAETELHKADVEKRKIIAREISDPQHLNQEDPIPVEQALSGEFPDGKGGQHMIPDRIDFIPYPFEEYGIWIMSQMQRWSQLCGKVDYREVVESVFQTENIRELAQAMGFATDEKPSLQGVRPFRSQDPFTYMLNQPYSAFQVEKKPLKRFNLPKPASDQLSDILKFIAGVTYQNLEVQMEVTADDEIGQLQQMLNEILLNMKFVQDALTEQNENLRAEIDERKQVEEKISHLNAVLQAIHSVNQLIVEEKDRDRLIKSTCHNLIATRGYFNAWIALFDKKGELVTTAEAGLGRDFLPMVEILKQGGVSDCSQKVLAQAGVHVIEDPSSTCTHCPLAAKYNGRSGMRVRLKSGEKIYGMLTVSIPKKLAQSREEQSLFQGVADDIALALRSAEMEGMRKQAEKALQASEEKYRALFEDSRDAIYITTRKGRLVNANPAFFDLFGYTREDMPLINARQLYVNPDDGRRFRKEIEQKGFVRDFEVKLNKNDGTEMDCLLNVVVQRADDGSIIGYQGIIHDVTEQRKLQAQFLQSQKMEAIGRLAGGVAHDFNNMLTSIIGYADIILMSLSQDDLRGDMVEIKKAADRAAALTGKLLAFSRKQVIQPRVMNLNDVIEDIQNMLRRLIGEDVALVAMLEPKLGLVKVDPSQMEQVVMNLAVNARDAMPRGGKLTIETANVDLDVKYFRNHGLENVPGPYVMLSFSDNGIGIDKKIRSLVFDPFFTTKAKGKGTGLGLATVYGIVKQSEGYVWVYSEPGKGTTFKIYLPRVTEEKAPLPKADVGQASFQGSETVLVVEDEEAVRNLTVKALRGYGYRVLDAQDAEAALTISNRHADPIDLLLTDVVMPGMSGRELAGQLTPSRPEMKVLYMSGYANNAIVNHGVLDEGVAYLSKPFTLEALAQRVREVLDEGRKDEG